MAGSNPFLLTDAIPPRLSCAPVQPLSLLAHRLPARGGAVAH